MARLQCCSMITSTSSSPVRAYKAIPLGPLYFCCGLMALVNDIQAMNPVYNKWYMDDGGIIGDVDLLKKVWDLLQTWLTDPDCSEPFPIRLDGVSEENQVKLGSDGFMSDFVEKKLLGRLLDTVNCLVEFEDTQEAAYLLRVSACSAFHAHNTSGAGA